MDVDIQFKDGPENVEELDFRAGLIDKGVEPKSVRIASRGTVTKTGAAAIKALKAKYGENVEIDGPINHDITGLEVVEDNGAVMMGTMTVVPGPSWHKSLRRVQISREVLHVDGCQRGRGRQDRREGECEDSRRPQTRQQAGEGPERGPSAGVTREIRLVTGAISVVIVGLLILEIKDYDGSEFQRRVHEIALRC